MRNTLFLVREIGEVAFVVLLMLIVIKEGFGELRLIPSESMLPLLQIEDRIVIEKVTRWWRPYQRGDILVFYPPTTILKNDPLSWVLRATGFSGFIFPKESNIDVAYIKRLIGEPGDKIQVVPNEGVFVNGQRLHEPYVMELAQSCTQVLPTQYCGTITVPRDSYFLMGDNRNQSADSRFWGFEPKERVIGRAVFRLWPLNRMGPLSLPEVSQD
jgi:signal peptidase I